MGGQKFDRFATSYRRCLPRLPSPCWPGLIQNLIYILRKPPADAASDERIAILMTVGIVFLLHVMPFFRHYPDYVTYDNPLLGGNRTAERLITLGWTDGYDQAAQWINQQPDEETARVVAWFGRGPVSFLSKGWQPPLEFDDPAFWFDADYTLLHINQRQRDLPSYETLQFFQTLQPIKTVDVAGLDYVRIYDVRDLEPPDFTRMHRIPAIIFDETIQLSAYQINDQRILAGKAPTIILFFKSLQDRQGDYIVRSQLIGDDDKEVARNDSTLSEFLDNDWGSFWPAYQIRPNLQVLDVPPATPAGVYRFVVSVLEASPLHKALTLDTLESTTYDSVVAVTDIHIDTAVAPEIGQADWCVVRLTSLRHPPAAEAGTTFVVQATAEGQTDGSLKISLRISDLKGKTLLQRDRELTGDIRFEFDLPSEMRQNQYKLEATVYDPDTLASMTTIDDQHLIHLSTIKIH